MIAWGVEVKSESFFQPVAKDYFMSADIILMSLHIVGYYISRHFILVLCLG